MARITLGLGTSHSPMLSTPHEQFDGHAVRDAHNPTIEDFQGRVARNRDHIAPLLRPGITAAKHQRVQDAIDTLHRTVDERHLDALIVVGDDQGEWFDEEDMPALAIYWGDEVESRPPGVEHFHPTIRDAYWGFYGDGRNRSHPVASGLGRELIERLTVHGFDVHQIRRQPAGDVPFGHAWGFVHQRVLRDTIVPIVPVMLNTYFPPNQPTPDRCWDLGVAIRDAIEAIPSTAAVGVVASGGLSHFIVDEQLDRRVLDGLARRDRSAISALPASQLQEGTSEIRNWIVTGAACAHLEMDVLAYLPLYRSEAGSGIGAAFAVWEECR